MWILDKYFLSFTLIVTFGQQMLGFIMAATCKFDTVTDLVRLIHVIALIN